MRKTLFTQLKQYIYLFLSTYVVHYITLFYYVFLLKEKRDNIFHRFKQ